MVSHDTMGMARLVDSDIGITPLINITPNENP